MIYRLPVIMPTWNRPELTMQAIESCIDNAGMKIHLILVDDHSTNQDTLNFLEAASKMDNVTVMLMPDSKGCGACKNAGAAIADHHEFIYFSDNDVYFHKDWAVKMIDALRNYPDIGILGGDRHPHHGISLEHDGLIFSDQQVGYSMLMRQSTWRELGAFTHAALGVYGSEDTDICVKCQQHGLKIASLSERVITHCGMTNSHNQPAAGADLYLLQEIPAGVIRL